ncbi:MAG: hypothetical protein KatS3mg119_1638 [Rhodothalassiaceae bacterium]|nr:MAG: hypothetical protein KatS3mg119_1638 [Rhodothalassiaceae bacterium]
MVRFRQTVRRMFPLLPVLALVGCAMDADLPPAPGSPSARLDDPAALDEMVSRLAQRGAHETALGFALRAAERAPGDVARWVRVHELAEVVGREDIAEMALGRIAALEPDHPLLAVARAAEALREGSPERAQAALDAIPPARRPAGYYRIRGLIAEWRGDGLAARMTYAEGLQRFPDDPGLIVNLALSYALAEDLAAANDLLSMLAERGPSLRQLALRNLVLAAMLAGDGEQARRLALEAGLTDAALAFYRAVAELDGPARARALITGRLPQPAAAPAPARPGGR